MITFAVSFITGIAAFNFFPYFPVSISALFISSLVLLFLLRRKGISPVPTLKKEGRSGESARGYTEGMKFTGPGFRVKLFILFVFLFGFLYSFVRQDTLPEIIFPDQDLTVEGTIVDVPEVSGDKFRFTVGDVVAEGKDIHGSVRLVLLPKLFGAHFNEHMLNPGNRISAIAKLREPVSFGNPGIYSRDLKGSGIAAVGYVKQVRLINRKKGAFLWISKKRHELGKLIDNSLSFENASFHKAIIPGLKRGISQDMRDAFSSTGLAHLLSISGTHFGLLAFILFSVIRVTIKCLPVNYFKRMTLYVTPTQIAVVLTLPILCIYAVVSGLSTPTIRSFIMVAIYMLALLVGRKDQWLNSLSIAAVIILLWQPRAFFDLSFLLSFVAVLSIGYVLEKRDEKKEKSTASSSQGGMRGGVWIEKAVGKIKTGMFITTAAVLGTAPIVALYFKQFPLISPVTNLLITPLICFLILPLGFISGFSALLFNMSSMPFSGVLDVVTYSVLKLIKGFSEIPFSSFRVHNPPVALIVLYYFALIFIMKSSLKWRFLPLFSVICIYLVSPSLSGNILKVTFLDTGQGEASVVELPDKKVMLIDGGMGTPDMGRRVIAPYLWSKGIRKIDYMVMSHPHPDHFGGLIHIMDNFDVGEIWFSGRMVEGADEFFQRTMKWNIPYKTLRRGDVLERDSYRMYVLHPYDEFHVMSPRGEFSNENSASLVLRIETDDASILFTGDIEHEAEENLLYLGRWLKSDVIKIPHHGGRTSSLGEFIKTVNPQMAAASVGRNNPFRHPHHETIDRYESAGVDIYRTDVDGAITITSTNDVLEIDKYEDSRLKKVTGWKDEIRNLKLLF